MLTGKKIAVLMGGPGAEREVSLVSGKAVLEALLDLGLDATPVDVTTTEIHLPEGTDLAYNVIHGTFGEDGQLQDAMERLGVPYTGAGPASSKLAIDKTLAKEKFVAAGVPTARSETVALAPGTIPTLTISAPLVIKPPLEGSSVGIQIVKSQADLPAALAKAAEKYGTVLVEEFIEGKELTVGILDGKAMPIVQITPPEGVYDMDSKYPWLSGKKGSEYQCPADLDLETTMAVQAAAAAAHRALGIEVYSRVDVLLDSENRPFVLEANTIPGMTATSLLPKSAAAAGIPFPELCVTIAELSLKLRS
ncbi:D-alanine--D-alanine ligase [Luteolibacter yonseiensis]|uniref:D-alanine--D-alanine ligase n=1 Tax=Luteolibacter yonseiensis TaxID=1144680 RepID=A0A934VAF5_9BACT|nr:D-alanine--D-alanine ligase [Luteolibacter yonseiensis]MBK1814806.1 D-alanine--D-alanine ligase [Luteolibacter yonseiensis]